MTRLPNLYTVVMTVTYRDMEPGVYRALRLWQDEDGKFVIDCERTDGTLGPQEWEYDTMGQALTEMPMIYAVQVLGARVTMTTPEPTPAQASAPAVWIVYLPIQGGGEEAQRVRRRGDVDDLLRRWTAGR